MPIHLSFDPEKHGRASLFLENEYRVVSMPRRELTNMDLIALLRRPPSFSEMAASPFISRATHFQRRVWECLCEIGFGCRRSYGEVAEMLGDKKLARAVGQACNRNPIALVIPCHRVVGKTGMGGFAGGAEMKGKLLELENREKRSSGHTMSSITWPI